MEEKVGNETGLVDWSSILWEELCQTSTVIRVLHKQCYQQLVHLHAPAKFQFSSMSVQNLIIYAVSYRELCHVCNNKSPQA